MNTTARRFWTHTGVAAALLTGLLVPAPPASADTRTVPPSPFCQFLNDRPPTRYADFSWLGQSADVLSGQYTTGESISVIFTNTDPYIESVFANGLSSGFIVKPIQPGETVQIDLGSSGFSGTAGVGFGFIGADPDGEVAAGGTVSFTCTPPQDVYTISPIVGIDPGDTFNDVRAGTAVPLRFEVSNYWGEPVTSLTEAPGSFEYAFFRQRCPIGVGVGDVITPPPPDSILGSLINFQNGTYQLNWKTQKSWSGTCWGFRMSVPYYGASFSLFHMR